MLGSVIDSIAAGIFYSRFCIKQSRTI